MDFFAHQDDARRKTRVAVLLFIAALGVILLVINAAATLAFWLFSLKAQHAATLQLPAISPRTYLLVSGATLLLILGASFYRMWQLNKGGAAIAAMVGGRRAFRLSNDAAERTLISVVEEMAIAAGMPVPGIYIMDAERGINAFAAGTHLHNAVVVVTRGALVALDRYELQAVIGHEFSHILNGDMTLNIRLAGILNGIQIIGAIGARLCLGLGRSPAHPRVVRGDSSSEVQTHPLLLAAGILLMIAGYGGLFIAKLIKSHISRQREFLADASAVQFTRSTDGIVGALNKMRAHILGTRVKDQHAETLSHLFFAESFADYFFPGLLSTHPPLAQRIKRLDPRFDLDAPIPPVAWTKPQSAAAVEQNADLSFVQQSTAAAVAISAGQLLASVGQPLHHHLQFAMRLRARMPKEVTGAVDDPDGVCAVIYALALDRKDEALRQHQLQCVADGAGDNAAIWTRNLFAVCQPLGDIFRLPILELALPGLGPIKGRSRLQFLAVLDKVINLDGKKSLRRFTLKNIVRARFDVADGNYARPQYQNLSVVRGHCAQLLSLLAHSGQRDPVQIQAAFAKGMAHLGVNHPTVLPAAAVDLEEVERGLQQLALLAPAPRGKVLHACIEVIAADGRINVAEGELLRLVAEALACPLPPILAAVA